MPTTRRRRFGAIAAALALLSTLAVLAIGAEPASADTVQTYACFSPLTNTYSTFPIPLTGSGSPDPINAGGSTNFTGISATFAIDSSLVVAGIGAGVLNFSTTPAGIGAVDSEAIDDPLGLEGVNVATNTTTAKLTASNATAGTANASLSGAVNATFYIVFDGADPASLQIYVETSPGAWPGSGTTGLAPVSVLPVPIPLSPSPYSVTSNSGGDISLASGVFTVNDPSPAPPATPNAPGGPPTVNERNNAPLILLNNLGVQANFFCWPGVSTGPIGTNGLPESSTDFIPAATASAIDTVTVNIPPTAPTCEDESTSVGAGQTVIVDLSDNCDDVNDDLDLTTLTPSAPSVGTLTPTATPGVFSYNSTGAPPNSTTTFSFTVDDLDTTTATSNVAQVEIDVLGNLCDATAAPCDLSQILTLPVQPNTRILEQTGPDVFLVDAVPLIGPDLMPGTADDPAIPQGVPIKLNGQPQLAVGQLNQMTVTNSRGDDFGWGITGQVTSFRDTTSPPACTSAPATWSNHCIPGDNLGWSPSAEVAHVQVLGDVASVAAGSVLPLPPGFFGFPALSPTGMGSALGRTLCTSPANHSGGTFTCNAGLALSVPASAAAGLYKATLTLTLA